MFRMVGRAAAALMLGGLAAGACARSGRIESTAAGAVVTALVAEDVLDAWPTRSREVAQTVIGRYGPPDEVTTSMLVWRDNGPWKRTIVYRDEVPHHFPKPHTDLLEQVVDYRVPTQYFDDLAAYDGSVVAGRTVGELAARCDNEAMNFLALNLAHDIATGKRTVDAARREYVAQAQAHMRGQSAPYTERLHFAVTRGSARDPDVAVMP